MNTTPTFRLDLQTKTLLKGLITLDKEGFLDDNEHDDDLIPN